tara:strand:- start:533 stop:709 length:177 start_codon:yes stop_codon:yes gene_type:complete
MEMTLLEAIQHDLNNGPTRESIKNKVPFEPVTVASIAAADLEAAFSSVEKLTQKGKIE